MTTVLFCDIDGVLLNYNEAYKQLWDKVFPDNPVEVVNPDGYSYRDIWNIPRLDSEKLAIFEAAKDYTFWSTMQPIYGVKHVLDSLYNNGVELVALSAAKSIWTEARLTNLEDYYGNKFQEVICLGHGNKGLFIDDVITTERAFIVDDYYPYIKNTTKATKILLDRGITDTDHPNRMPDADTIVINEFKELNNIILEGDLHRCVA